MLSSSYVPLKLPSNLGAVYSFPGWYCFARLVIRVGGCRGKGTELSAAGDVLPNYLLPPWCRLLVVYDTFVERVLLQGFIPVQAMGTITLPAGFVQFAPVVRFLAHEPLIFEVFSFGKVQIITSFAQKKRPCLDAFVCLYMQLLYMVDYIRIAPIKILYNSKA